ncbi:hypothetical protein [Janthinobacterium sp. LB2P70]|uniref:hypothetical protein n=1 Tax=Janthinobacterium sp. LB2P70 TaxID=3424197 RepID=UPI003F21437F
MNTTAIYEHSHYHYQITSRKISSWQYQGVILVLAFDEILYDPSVEITTSATFKKPHAAEIEATVLVYELIESGVIKTLLPVNVS